MCALCYTSPPFPLRSADFGAEEKVLIENRSTHIPPLSFTNVSKHSREWLVPKHINIELEKLLAISWRHVLIASKQAPKFSFVCVAVICILLIHSHQQINKHNTFCSNRKEWKARRVMNLRLQIHQFVFHEIFRRIWRGLTMFSVQNWGRVGFDDVVNM